MAEANNDEAFLYDDDGFDEKELVQELLTSGIYGEQTNLDGILEAVQKNRDAINDRVKKLNIFFGSEPYEGESQVAPDSETPTEKNEVNMDNNLLQNALPGPTGLDVSSKLEKLPLKDTVDEPKPVTDFPSPEVLLKPDEPLQTGGENKLEPEILSLGKVNHKAIPKALPPLHEPLQTGGETEAETLSLGKVNPKATPKTLLPLHQPLQTGGKPAAQTLSLGKEETKATPKALLLLHQPLQTDGEPAAETLSLGKVDPKATPKEHLQTEGETEAEYETLSLSEVNLRATPEVLAPLNETLQTGGETEAETLSLGKVDLKATTEVQLTLHEPGETGGKTKTDAETLSLGETDLKITPEAFLALPEPHHTDGEAQTAAETPLLGEVDLMATTEVVVMAQNVQNGGEKKPQLEPPICSSSPSKRACSEWQTTGDVHSSGTEASGAEAPSTRVLTAGCPHERDELHSGCLNIRSVMPSDQACHIPSTSINEVGTVAGRNRSAECQSQLADHEVLTDDTPLSKKKDKQQHNDCQSNKKNKRKKTKAEKDKKMKKTMADTKTTKEDTKKIKVDTKKTKVDAKEKHLNDRKAKQTKSKKFHRRLISLLCCCVFSQEKNEDFNEIEQSTAKNESHCEHQNSFQSIDLNS